MSVKKVLCLVRRVVGPVYFRRQLHSFPRVLGWHTLDSGVLLDGIKVFYVLIYAGKT